MQIIFRVSITLFLLHKNAILAANDISTLANVFREMLKSEIVTNCHEFMQSIFTMPGTLKRSEIKHLRTELAKQKIKLN